MSEYRVLERGFDAIDVERGENVVMHWCIRHGKNRWDGWYEVDVDVIASNGFNDGGPQTLQLRYVLGEKADAQDAADRLRVLSRFFGQLAAKVEKYCVEQGDYETDEGQPAESPSLVEKLVDDELYTTRWVCEVHGELEPESIVYVPGEHKYRHVLADGKLCGKPVGRFVYEDGEKEDTKDD